MQSSLRLILQLTNGTDRYILLDSLFELFQKKLNKDKQALEKFARALVMLKNLGFFTKSSHKSVWKKMFYSKSSYRTENNIYNP